jgi:heme-degrading monooxygenase HmoA
MYTIIWEYLVKIEYLSEYEKFYASDGKWDELFKKGTGYLSTELLRDSKQPRRYITIDRWVSSEEYEAFLIEWQEEYQTLDVQCGEFTEYESLLGKWDSVNRDLR